MIAVTVTDRQVAAHEGDRALWTIALPIDTDGTPFREAIAWPAAEVVAIGADQQVDFHAIATGAIVASIALGADGAGDHFGHVALGDDDMLYVLGWRHVIAVAPSLAIRWIARDIAVDGIIWRDQRGPHLRLSAELDPPGGWVDVTLDAATGEPISPP